MSNPDRILIIGGSGMVGAQILFGIKPSHAELDITDSTSVERAVEKFQPEAILNLAGLVDLRKCEEDPAKAKRLNTDGARNVALAAAGARIPLIYFSSCLVFDGKKETPYTESDEPNPQTIYGKTKLAGELATLEEAPHALVVRTGWLFGGFEHDIKFIRRFYDLLAAGKAIRATSDRSGSPTYVPDLISEAVRLLQAGESGVFHVVNDGVASYFEVAEYLRNILASLTSVSPAPSKEMDHEGVPRGMMEALASERGTTLRPYTEALSEYIAALKSRTAHHG